MTFKRLLRERARFDQSTLKGDMTQTDATLLHLAYLRSDHAATEP